jgi:hypothetical protein
MHVNQCYAAVVNPAHRSVACDCRCFGALKRLRPIVSIIASDNASEGSAWSELFMTMNTGLPIVRAMTTAPRCTLNYFRICH